MQRMEVDRTFAFVDICGFTSFTEHEGSVMATQMLAAFRAATRDIASRRGVRIAKWLGDGAMVVGVEVQPVLEAFLEIEQRSAESSGGLALRYGVTFGKAILFEGDDYIGSVVNLSKRLCDLADPHEILVGPSVDTYLPPWAKVEETGELVVKGFDGTLRRERLCMREMRHPIVDPVCRLALDPEYAVGQDVADDGTPVVFCSAPCEVTWRGSRASLF
jgi:adenylate cyclase